MRTIRTPYIEKFDFQENLMKTIVSNIEPSPATSVVLQLKNVEIEKKNIIKAPISTKFHVMIVLLWLFNLWDALCTMYVVGHGFGREMNPIMALFLSLGFEYFLWSKLLGGSIMVWASYVLIPHRTVRWVPIALFAIYGLLSIWYAFNFILMAI